MLICCRAGWVGVSVLKHSVKLPSMPQVDLCTFFWREAKPTSAESLSLGSGCTNQLQKPGGLEVGLPIPRPGARRIRTNQHKPTVLCKLHTPKAKLSASCTKKSKGCQLRQPFPAVCPEIKDNPEVGDEVVFLQAESPQYLRRAQSFEAIGIWILSF